MNKTKLFFSVLASAAPFVGLAGQTQPTQKPQRNMVIFIADDLARNELGCYGGQNVKTPNIDRFAAEGVKFTGMVSSTTMCSPTRASIYTGLYPVSNGVYKNHGATKPEVKSVVHYLEDLGYRVGLTGKTHFKPKSVYPFEIVDGFEPNCVRTTADYTTEGIVEFMGRQGDEPFCLFVCSTHPHAPWTVGDPSKFDPDKLILPPHMVDNAETRSAFTRYLAEIEALDQEFGDVLKSLNGLGKEDETLVMFCGEQGPQFPGGKWTGWDYGQKSGFIVRTPEGYSKGQATDAIVQYEDVLPTLISYAGGKVPAGLDGESFLSVLEGKKTKHRKWAYGMHNNVPEGTPYPIRTIRNDEYKLILNLLPEASYYEKHLMGKGRENYWQSWVRDAKVDKEAKYWVDRYLTRPEVELYNTVEDPWELNNLANEKKMQPIIRKMKKELFAWMKEEGDPGKVLDVESAD